MTMVEEKFVVIDTNGSIPELGGIAGPIINPFWLDVDTITQMIGEGYKITEVNSNNIEDRTLLTLSNVTAKIYDGGPIKTVHANTIKAPTPKAPTPTESPKDIDGSPITGTGDFKKK